MTLIQGECDQGMCYFSETIVDHVCIRKKYFCVNHHSVSVLFHTSVF